MSSRSRHRRHHGSAKTPRRKLVDREPNDHVGRTGRAKVAFLTEAGALEAAGSRPGCGPYRCHTCGLWHLGHPS